MKRTHTILSISTEVNKTKRAVQFWFNNAQKQYPNIGEEKNGCRYFSDEEREILMSFGRIEEKEELETSQTTVEQHPSFVRSNVSLESQMVQVKAFEPPTQYDPYALTHSLTGNDIQVIDPLEAVNFAIQMLQTSLQPLEQKVESQKRNVIAHLDAIDQVDEVTEQAIRKAERLSLRSEILAEQQDIASRRLAKKVENVANLGKPILKQKKS